MQGLCGRVCDNCSFFSTCGGCSLCEASVCKKQCCSCFALCFHRPFASSHLYAIGGPKIFLNQNSLMDIPSHIPIIPDRLSKMPKYEHMPVIGIHAGNAFARNGESVTKRFLTNGFAGALNLDPRTSGILEFYVKDRTLEGFWDKRKDIYPGLKELKLLAVIAPNFSVYEDAPRLDHLYNIKRSTIAYNEMLDADIPAIPDVSWFNKTDIDQWSKEIQRNNIKIISFSFQVVDVGLKTSNIWRTYLMGFRYLCENIDPDVEIIIAGLVSPFRIQEVYKASKGRRIHILNQSSFVQSRRGMLSETRIQNNTIPFDDLFERNTLYFNRIYQEMGMAGSGSDEAGVFQLVMSWTPEELIKFHNDYTTALDGLCAAYSMDKEKVDLIFSIVCRQIRKKKIKHITNL